ncbi:glycosyltransferase [Acetobacter nitrogenifigens DSM 23921 = NBRC 105050]|uniref:Glycosyltransferase 2-like domain-containing protein n=1 Tax=Acetobacter nitrogenifigens DSM 23921 = NBRC 105050 TaxID=1120919 RepID=A0A511XFN1_9PROT|nr:glycosyltransferase [Acetobacter nitrogenifigens]GBQ98073.1 glycosyltransferase [Acetobacter nitrogenifigens DSM 23921 = NBRC 105050]GEN61715.1 hypothetical protein ANI02nite_35990 [Acetobacter nitrogenifigens DSM 23921 = NBRC 105050]
MNIFDNRHEVDPADTVAINLLASDKLDVAFRRGDRLDHGSAWFGHIPFAHWLIHSLRPNILVELGTHAGISYSAFCLAVESERLATRCFAVDTWKGDEHAGYYDSDVYENLNKYNENNFEHFSKLLRCTFDEALSKFDNETVDLLHIDGLHTYEAVKKDFESWKPKLTSRAVVLFHDTSERKDDFGVWRLWRELTKQYPSFEFFHSHGLGVLCVGDDMSDGLRALTSLSGTEVSRLRSHFSRLGERWQLEAEANQLREGVRVRDVHIRNIESDVHSTKAELARLAEQIVVEQNKSIQSEGIVLKTEEKLNKLQIAANQAELEAVAAMRDVAKADQISTSLRIEIAALRSPNQVNEQVKTLQLELASAFVQESANLIRLNETLDEANRLRGELAQTVVQRDTVLASTAWKATWPVRWTMSKAPKTLRWHGRRALKAIWWSVTPWNITRRLRVRQDLLARTESPLPSTPNVANAFAAPRVGSAYAEWITLYERPFIVENERAVTIARFCFLVPEFAGVSSLTDTLRSLAAQQRYEWRVVIGVMAGESISLPEDLASILDRVIQIRFDRPLDRGGKLQKLLNAADGEWISVVDSGDILAEDTLEVLQRNLTHNPEAKIFYCDEDQIDANGERLSPRLKPSWSPEMLQAYNYFGRLTFISTNLAKKSGGFIEGHASGSEWGLNLRAASIAGRNPQTIVRIPRILCHCRAGDNRDRPDPNSSDAAEHRFVLQEYWREEGIANAKIATQPDGTQRSDWSIENPPFVSIIIPNRNSVDLLSMCMSGILYSTTYKNYEIIIVENNSNDQQIWDLYRQLEERDNVRVLRADGPFNYSRSCNKGASIARGDFLLFLNNDIEVVDENWLHELVRVAMIPGVGVVGTRLRYPTGELQHAGVSLGIHLYGLMFHRGVEQEWGVFGSPNHTRNWLAVMGACQMVRRHVFDLVDGFDEAYRIANSDVALSLRAGRAGWRTAYTPFATLIHHEGMSRGRSNPAEDMARAANDVYRLGYVEDPYLHPGLSALSPVPRLRGAGEPDLREQLRLDMDRFISATGGREAPLDLSDDGQVGAAAGLPRDIILWHPSPAALIGDVMSAARWVIDLLRTRADIRMRFPRALSDGIEGPFARWITGKEGRALGLSIESQGFIADCFAKDLSSRVLQLYYWREDLRKAFPLGLLPAGRRGFSSWLLRHRHEGALEREEVWWTLILISENPSSMLVETYRFTPAWQDAHPAGLTIFGCQKLASWISESYGIPSDTVWLHPDGWSSGLKPSEQIRLAYAAFPEWRSKHPNAFSSEVNCLQFLRWLVSDDARLPEDVCAQCIEWMKVGIEKDLIQIGASVIGHFCYPSGLRVSAEAIADSIEIVGGSVSRRDVRTDAGDDPHHRMFGGLESHDVTIIHTQPEPFFNDAYQRADLAQKFPGAYKVAYWYWEFDQIPDYWATTAQKVDEVWTATEFVASGLRKKLNVPVKTLFPGVRIGKFTRRSRSVFGLKGEEGDRFCFLFSFHMGSIMERKNPIGLIKAFQAAFQVHEPVDLVIKTTSFGRFDTQVAELRQLSRGSNIVVIDKTMTPDENLALMAACDSYVSLHRSEGLGLTMAEAMLLGKPVIATGYSGNMDFMDHENSLLVDYELVSLGTEIPPYSASYYWANPSVEHAATLMRRLYERPEDAKLLGRRAKLDSERRLSLESSGLRFNRRLMEINAARRARFVTQ